MLAVITFLCGLSGLWINIYSLFAIALYAIYYYGPHQKIRWEGISAFAGFILGALNIILVAVTKQI